jgi:hypothetical protein
MSAPVNDPPAATPTRKPPAAAGRGPPRGKASAFRCSAVVDAAPAGHPTAGPDSDSAREDAFGAADRVDHLRARVAAMLAHVLLTRSGPPAP